MRSPSHSRPYPVTTVNSSDYLSRSPDYYLDQLPPQIRDTLTPDQFAAFRALLDEAIPKPSPKIVDLRFAVDMLISRFYVVLFVGKDRRRQPRKYISKRLTRIGNIIAVIILLIAANLTISGLLIFSVYLLKSALNINVLPGHLPELLKGIFGR